MIGSIEQDQTTGVANAPRVRPMTAGDWRAVRMLLPEAVHAACGCAVFVATAAAAPPARRVVIGAVAVSPDMRRDPAPGPRVAVHVAPPWRRRGVGTALLRRAGAHVAARGGHAVYAWRPVLPDSDAARGWRSLGFRQALSFPLTHFDAVRGTALVQDLYDRLAARGSIPPDARVVPLRGADPDAVARLQLTYLGGTPDALLPRLHGRGRDAFDPDLSQVLLRGDRVVGIALVRRLPEGVCWWDSNVLHPAVRGRWANVMLKLAVGHACLPAGVKTFAFENYSAHADSLTSVQKVAGVTVWRVEPYRLLPPHPDAR